jgi:hypothetical protein
LLRPSWKFADQVSEIIVNGSKTTLTGESRFLTSTPVGIEPGSLMTGSKRVGHLTSGTVRWTQSNCRISTKLCYFLQGSPCEPIEWPVSMWNHLLARANPAWRIYEVLTKFHFFHEISLTANAFNPFTMKKKVLGTGWKFEAKNISY